MKNNNKPAAEFSAPELYGFSLVAAVNAMEYLPLVKSKIASDANLYKLRGYDDVEDHPTVLPIPVTYMHAPSNADFNQRIPKLDPEHKSSSSFLSFWDYHEAYTQSKTTPTEVAQKLLLKLNDSKKMNWLRFQCDDIVQQAEESTERYKSNSTLSQMDGIFVSIKEELDIKGLETKVGTSFINDGNPAKEDSTLVSKLRKAGAIIVGSNVMNELGWDTFTVNPNTGIPKNPYGPSHSCGGSSGGSSGFVAGGLSPISIGADGGGSIRIPAALCGLYGLKTSYARISAYGGATVDPSVGSYGPIAATADDMTLTYCVTAGPDAKDATTLFQPPIDIKDYNRYTDLSDLTIAITPEWYKVTSEPAILEQVEFVKNALQKLGARIVEIEISDLDLLPTAHSITICSEMHNYASRHSENHTKFLSHTRLMCGTASALEARDYVRAQQVRTRLMNHLRNVFEEQKVDLILTPTTAIVSPEIPKKANSHGMSNAKWTMQTMAYCTLANLTGIPAVSVPAGFHGTMPIGVQFMAAWWNEALLCRIAKACENIPNIDRKRPSDEHWYAINDLLQ